MGRSRPSPSCPIPQRAVRPTGTDGGRTCRHRSSRLNGRDLNRDPIDCGVARGHVDELTRSEQGIGFLIFPLPGNRFTSVTTDVPPPPAPGRLRVRFVNETAVTITPSLGGIAGTPIGPGEGATLALTGPPSVSNGNDTGGVSYPQTPPASTRCTHGGTAGLLRGTGYILTFVTTPGLGTSSCPHRVFPIVQQRIG